MTSKINFNQNESQQKLMPRVILLLNFLCLFFILGINACGKNENSKRRDSLSGFENAVSLGEIVVEEVTLAPDPTPNSKIEEITSPVPVAEPVKPGSLNSQKELLGVEKEIIPPSIADLKKAQRITPEVNLKRDTVGSLQKLLSLKTKIISITGDDTGRIYLGERYNVTVVENGAKNVLLDSEIYQKIFSESMPAIATLAFTKSFGLWIGFTNGEIINFHNNSWTKKLGGPSQKRYAIKKIIEISGRIFIIGKGFYEWESKFDRFLSSDDLRNEIITDIAALDEENLVISTQNSIRTISLLTRNMNTLYNSFTGDFPIRSVIVQGGNILVGGNQGVLTLSKNGYPRGRFASNIQIEEIKSFDPVSGIILDTENKIYVYNLQNVLKVNSHNKLLPQVKISNIQLVGNSNTVVIGGNAGVVYSGSSKELLEFVLNAPIDEEPFLKNFSNACNAAEELIGRKYFSRQIATTRIDDKRFVFFNGEQVCPNSAGFMRADGYTAVVKSNEEIEVFEYNKRQAIKLPNNILSDDISKMFIDSEDRLYAGTKRGIYLHKNEQWTQPERKEGGANELLEDPVTDILEDIRGNIWFSTRIKATKENQAPPDHYSALHLRTKNNRWADFGKLNGLNTLGISSLVEDQGVLYFGSAFGFFTLSADSKIHSFSKLQGLKNFIVENLTIDSKKRVWISHGFFQSGLSWVENDSYFHTTKEQGLFSNSILNVAEDDRNRIWVMDTSGLVTVYSIDNLKAIATVSKFERRRAFVSEFTP